MDNNIINVGAVPLNRGPYSDQNNYYQKNLVTMCSCIFQCNANKVTGVPPLVLSQDGSGHYVFANESVWTCVIDNLELYNRTVEAIDAIARAEAVTDDMVNLSDRVTNEENTRISNENTRKQNESKRISAENTRKENESVRIDNENQRVENEKTRKLNEDGRIEAETIRKQNEVKRVNQYLLCIEKTDLAAKGAALALEVGSHPTYIGENGYWMVWNVDADRYEESDDFALGDSCFPNFGVDPEQMMMTVNILDEDAERFELREDGYLVLNY